MENNVKDNDNANMVVVKRGAGRPRYVPLIPTGKFSMKDFCVLNGIDILTGKGERCSKLTLVHYLDHDGVLGNNSLIVKLNETVKSASPIGLGRPGFMYQQRAEIGLIDSIMTNPPFVDVAPVIDIAPVVDIAPVAPVVNVEETAPIVDEVPAERLTETKKPSKKVSKTKKAKAQHKTVVVPVMDIVPAAATEDVAIPHEMTQATKDYEALKQSLLA